MYRLTFFVAALLLSSTVFAADQNESYQFDLACAPRQIVMEKGFENTKPALDEVKLIKITKQGNDTVSEDGFALLKVSSYYSDSRPPINPVTPKLITSFDLPENCRGTCAINVYQWERKCDDGYDGAYIIDFMIDLTKQVTVKGQKYYKAILQSTDGCDDESGYVDDPNLLCAPRAR